jgi:uncharacterized protein DUF3617
MMRTRFLLLAACLWPSLASADPPPLQPGLYEVTYTLELPNVVATGVGPSTFRRCITTEDLRTGSAFGVLGENPIRACPLQDYSISAGRALYRIECPGPNAPSATGAFDLASASYRGVITMNMGGKNMTMSERQRGRRLGACP